MQYKFEKPVHGDIGTVKYQCTIEWRNGKIIADEPVSSGGGDTGPDPHSLLLASVASCALVTMRMYIDRKGWDIPSLSVNVNMFQETKDDKLFTIIDRDIVFHTPVPDGQRLRLQQIVQKCPVEKLLEGDIKVRNFVFREGEGEAREKLINYANEAVTVEWRPELCQHSTRCFTQLPEVFNPRERKWINPSGAPAQKLDEQIQKCPSGALRFHYNNKK